MIYKGVSGMENRIDQQMDYYRLTHTQKSMWDIEKKYPNTSMENIGGVAIIKGELNLDILRKAIQIFIKRNDGLRLRVREKEEEVYQYIYPYEPEKIDCMDFSNSTNPKEEFEKWSNHTFKIPFKLEDCDLYHFSLFKISNKEGGLLLRIHHIICDGWSTSIIQKGIIETYCKLIKNEVVNTTPAPSYIDFIEKEDKYISSSRFLKDKEYWNEKLRNIPEEFLYYSTHEVEGRRSIFELDLELSVKIKKFLEEKRIPINTFFLIIMGLYLNKKTQKEDIIIGNPIFNRLTKRDRETVGMFISKMPVRLTINKEKTVLDFINEVALDIKRDLYHQRYPYNELIKDLEISKKSYTSLYKYSINCYNTNYLKNMGGNTTIESIEYYNGNQSYSLQVIVKEVSDNKITLSIDHRISEYTKEEINHMYEYMIYIALHLIENSGKRIKEIIN